jgi:hypothetical protein
VRTRRDLRHFAVQSAVAGVVVTLIWLAVHDSLGRCP